MKRIFAFLSIILVISVLLAGCGGGEAAPAVEEASETSGEIALTVGETGYSLEELQAMDTITAEAAKKDGSTVEYTGVLVVDLLADAGLAGETVVFVASDGYEAEAAAAELEACSDCIVAFDGDELRMVLPGFPSNLQVKGVVEINSR